MKKQHLSLWQPESEAVLAEDQTAGAGRSGMGRSLWITPSMTRWKLDLTGLSL